MNRLQISQTDLDRFFRFVLKQPPTHLPTGCWEWQGATHTDRHGNATYGRFSYQGKKLTAHKFSFRLHHHDDIPEGYEVMHACDNQVCVNPEHLSIGTKQDNIDDKVQKGRAQGSIRLLYKPKGPTSGRLKSSKAVKRLKAKQAAKAGGKPPARPKPKSALPASVKTGRQLIEEARQRRLEAILDGMT